MDWNWSSCGDRGVGMGGVGVGVGVAGGRPLRLGGQLGAVGVEGLVLEPDPLLFAVTFFF